MTRASLLVACALPIVLSAAIWFPVVDYYRVPAARISESSLDDFLSRPPDSTLEALGREFLGSKATDPTGFPAGSPEERLRDAGLFQIDAELDRYELTRDSSQFEALARFVVDFCERANADLSFDEFLWNDHATANRIFVLAKFWKHYRSRPGLDRAAAAAVLRQVAKSAEFLASDKHYTYWTNHGVMESIALLHAANAFPALADRDRFVAVALERLRDQLKFYVSESGWVMEHSAGYQEFGVNLLSTLVTELEMLGIEVPSEWRAKTAESRRVLAWLARPDSSIPNFGDSGSSVTSSPGLASSCGDITAGAKYWPEGYFIAWDVDPGAAACAQTAVVWSSFVSGAHGRPNQLSVHYWARGVDYLKSSGYWPYGDPERLEAVGWRGSNAPHVSGEKSDGVADLRRRGLCAAEDFRFVDLERRSGVEGAVLRRQVVDLGLTGLLVIDSGEGNAGNTRESVWRIDERVAVIGPDGASVAPGAGAGSATDVLVIAGPSLAVGPLSDLYAREGHVSPAQFSAVGGYGRVDAYPAYAVTSPLRAPTLVALVPRERGGSKTAYHFSEYVSPERWTVEDAPSRLVVERNADVVTLKHPDGGVSSRCAAVAGAGVDDGIRDMEASYARLASRHRIFQAWIPYRAKVTAVVGVLFLAQLILLAALSRAAKHRLRGYVVAAAIVGWLGLGAYIELVYLAH